MMLNLLTRRCLLSRPSFRTYSKLFTPLRTQALLLHPARFVHARGYNEFTDCWSHQFHEVNFALGGCKNTDNFVYAFRRYGHLMTDVQMAYAFYFIASNSLEKTPEFWSVIFPAVKKQLATLDRNCTKSLQHFIDGASAMQLQDNEFWELVEQKLYD